MINVDHGIIRYVAENITSYLDERFLSVHILFIIEHLVGTFPSNFIDPLSSV